MISSYLLPVTTQPQSVAFLSCPTAWIGLKVRTLGAATYIGIGDNLNQEFRLTAEKDYLEIGLQKGHVTISDIFAVADADGALLEVLCLW